jgi:hypothetical protein
MIGNSSPTLMEEVTDFISGPATAPGDVGQDWHHCGRGRGVRDRTRSHKPYGQGSWRTLKRREFLMNGAAQRLHLKRLPAYTTEPNPGEGVWV